MNLTIRIMSQNIRIFWSYSSFNDESVLWFTNGRETGIGGVYWHKSRTDPETEEIKPSNKQNTSFVPPVRIPSFETPVSVFCTPLYLSIKRSNPRILSYNSNKTVLKNNFGSYSHKWVVITDKDSNTGWNPGMSARVKGV